MSRPFDSLRVGAAIAIPVLVDEIGGPQGELE
jgi:hypothetical protein